MFGAVAGLAAQMIAYPLDAIRRPMQVCVCVLVYTCEKLFCALVADSVYHCVCSVRFCNWDVTWD